MESEEPSNQELLLEILSGGGDPTGEYKSTALCVCCSHEGQRTCPYDGKRTGLCNAFVIKALPKQEINEVMLDYLRRNPISTPVQQILDLR